MIVQSFKNPTILGHQPISYNSRNSTVSLYESLRGQHPTAPSWGLCGQHPAATSWHLRGQHPAAPLWCLRGQHPAVPSWCLRGQHPAAPSWRLRGQQVSDYCGRVQSNKNSLLSFNSHY